MQKYRSKAEWLNTSDKNTSFFHNKVSNKKKEEPC